MSDITTKIAQLQSTLAALNEDAQKTDNGNKSAGTRVRKAMQEVIASCKEVRKDVLEARKNEE
jgi:hypothetical protein